MAIQSFMNVAGGIASLDGTLISEGAGGVMNINHVDGSIETIMPLANGGGISVGPDPVAFTDTATGFIATDMSDPASAINYIDTPMGYAGTDGSSITETSTGSIYNSGDADIFDLSGEIGLPASVDIPEIDISSIGSLGELDISQVVPDISNIADVDLGGLADIAGSLDVVDMTAFIDGDAAGDIVGGIIEVFS